MAMTASAAWWSALSPAGSAAQLAVEGEVLDDVTGLPVGGAVVAFPDLGLGTLADDFGYFAFAAVPEGAHAIVAYHVSYVALSTVTPVAAGETLVIKLTPNPMPIPGLDVTVRHNDEIDGDRTGRASDFISSSDVATIARRTSHLLDVLRSKAPPRLNIQQRGGPGGISFCIRSTRRSPSVRELMDLGTGCSPALVVVDGVVVYAPPAVMEMAVMEAPTLPEDVAYMILTQDPNEIESIRVRSPSDAFFRYGYSGRLGVVEIKTRHPRKKETRE